MARPKFKINEENKFDAYFWCKHKIERAGRKGFSFADDHDKFFEANEELSSVSLLSPESIHAWCEKYFAERDWKQLQGAIRAKKHNRKKSTKTITISEDAWWILHEIAEAKGMTLSEVIQTRTSKLSPAEMRAANQ